MEIDPKLLEFARGLSALVKRTGYTIRAGTEDYGSVWIGIGRAGENLTSDEFLELEVDVLALTDPEAARDPRRREAALAEVQALLAIEEYTEERISEFAQDEEGIAKVLPAEDRGER